MDRIMRKQFTEKQKEVIRDFIAESLAVARHGQKWEVALKYAHEKVKSKEITIDDVERITRMLIRAAESVEMFLENAWEKYK